MVMVYYALDGGVAEWTVYLCGLRSFLSLAFYPRGELTRFWVPDFVDALLFQLNSHETTAFYSL